MIEVGKARRGFDPAVIGAALGVVQDGGDAMTAERSAAAATGFFQTRPGRKFGAHLVGKTGDQAAVFLNINIRGVAGRKLALGTLEQAHIGQLGQCLGAQTKQIRTHGADHLASTDLEFFRQPAGQLAWRHRADLGAGLHQLGRHVAIEGRRRLLVERCQAQYPAALGA